MKSTMCLVVRYYKIICKVNPAPLNALTIIYIDPTYSIYVYIGTNRVKFYH